MTTGECVTTVEKHILPSQHHAMKSKLDTSELFGFSHCFSKSFPEKFKLLSDPRRRYHMPYNFGK